MRLNHNVLDVTKSASNSEYWMRFCAEKQRLIRLVGYGTVLVAVIVLSDSSTGNASFMNPEGPVAASQKAHLIKIFAYTMIAVLPVLILVPLMLWRYRYKNTSARYSPNWEFSGVLDSFMWGVPFLIIVILSVQLFQNTRELDPYKPIKSDQPSLLVQVVGLDWKWLFIYPELGIASVGEMAFPTGRPVTLRLTADTVMQSFMIGSLAGQVYTMPGMRTELNLMSTKSDKFRGMNTQFNGVGFTSQKFNAISMSDSDFNTWVEKVRTSGIALDQKSYRVLGLPSTAMQAHAALGTDAMPSSVVYFKSVPPKFFADILRKYHSGKAIALENQPGSVFFGKKAPTADPDSPSKGDR